MTHALPASTPPATDHLRLGLALVAGSAVTWSFGGAIARFITAEDSWTVVFWRAVFAAGFLVTFMLLRDGRAGTIRLFRNMGLAGLAVGTCFAVASTSFVVALTYTTVANILLMQAGVPLLAALLSWLLFGEKVSGATWLAISAVIAGVAIMVSASFTGEVSPVGDGLALLIAVMLSVATVITRRAAHVRMTPAVCLGTMISGAVSGALASGHAVSASDLGWLFLFGAVNLGMGLAMFATGARLIPAALAALVGTLEPVLGPIWVWLVHGEVPGVRTILGGAIVFLALFTHLLADWLRQRAARR